MNRQVLIQVSAAPPSTVSDVAFATKRDPADELENDWIDARGPVCVVDDDDWVCDSLSVLLETYGFTVLAYRSGAELLRDERRAKAKFLVVDQHMPGLDGLGVIAELRSQGTFLPTILTTARLDTAIARRATKIGVLAILEKPFPVARLVELIDSALGPHD